MEKIYEIFKTISSNFNLLLSISGVSLALLLSPKTNDYKQVINELNSLKNIDIRQYENFIKERTTYTDFLPKQGTLGYGLDSLLQRAYFHRIRGDSLKLEKPNRYYFVVDVAPYVGSYKQRPIDGSLKEWEAWIRTDSNASCFRPNWRYLDPDRKPPINSDTLYQLRHFLLNKSKYRSDVYHEYFYRFYLEKDTITTSESNSEARRGSNIQLEDWYSKLDTISYDSMQIKDAFFNPEIINSKHIVIEGRQVVDSGILIVPNSGVYTWLKQSPYWQLISKSDSLSLSILPASHTIWSEIADKTIEDALGYLINKRNESKSISLFGIPISYAFILIIVPVAYLSMNIFLTLHLKYLIKELQIQNDRPTYPWIGFYQFFGATLFQAFVFLLLPLFICLFLILRLAGLVDIYLLLLSIFLSLSSVATGYLLLRENKRLKELTN